MGKSCLWNYWQHRMVVRDGIKPYLKKNTDTWWHRKKSSWKDEGFIGTGIQKIRGTSVNNGLIWDVQATLLWWNRENRDSYEGSGFSWNPRTDSPTATARLDRTLTCTNGISQKRHWSCTWFSWWIATKMAHSGLVLMLESDTEKLEKT